MQAEPRLTEFIQPLQQACLNLSEITGQLLTQEKEDKERLNCAAHDYLHLFGYTATALMRAKMAPVASLQSNDSFYQAKPWSARYSFNKRLPRSES